MNQTFGEDLKDQIQSINNYTQNGIHFINELRDFYKEKANIEKEYGHKLEQLSKKYQKQKDKLGQQLMDVQSPIEQSSKYGTLYKAWEELLSQTEEVGKNRMSLAEKMTNEVTDVLKTQYIKKEESRKKHMAFYQKLSDDRSKANFDKDKSKEKYDQLCDQVEATKQKLEKAPDEKQAEKLRKQLNVDTMEMHNSKNNYILALNVANALKKKFYFTDMPALMNALQHANENRIEQLKEMMVDYLALENEALHLCQQNIDKILVSTQLINSVSDSSTFISLHKQEWQEPVDFKFEPTLLWKDTDQLVADEQAKIYLYNKVAKIKSKQDALLSDIQIKTKELEGLTNLKDAYLKNPSTGDAEEVYENLLETERALTAMQSMRIRYEVSLQVIQNVIGNSESGKRHSFQKQTFAIPTQCDFCLEKIWGLTQQGLSCKECGYNCHAKCEMKVPPFCTAEKGGAVTARSKQTIMSTAAIITPSSGAPSPLTVPQIAPLTLFQRAKVLFSYEAQNADEVSITEGDTLRLLEQDDGTGWLRVESNGKEGFVPANYVEIMRQNSTASLSSLQPKMAKALYDYQAQNDNEISFKEGDLIEVYKQGTDGWWEGYLKSSNQKGEFPGNYVEMV